MSRELVIEAGRTERRYWQDIWEYRELFYFLSWRDILVRYKQTAIGFAWALLRPFLLMVVFTLLRRVGGVAPEGDVPQAILVYSGVLPWQLFATAATSCSNSLITNNSLIAKLYFPRLIVPASSVVVSLVDFSIAFSILLGLMAWYEYVPSWRIILLPIFLMIAVATTLAIGLWAATLNVEYRDFRYIVPFMIQIGMFVSPVAYSSSAAISELLPEGWGFLYFLNPMVGVIDGFRWCILAGDADLYLPGLLASLLIVVTLLSSGLWYFRRMERTFADVI